MSSELPLEWYRAATLTERRSNLGALIAPPLEMGEAKARRWQETNRLSFEDMLALRSYVDGLSYSQFAALLSEDARCLKDRLGPQDWMVSLLAASDRADDAAAAATRKRYHEQSSFLTLVAPLIAETVERSRAAIREILDSAGLRDFDSGPALAGFVSQLEARLDSLLLRTLVLEMHVASLEDRLTGSTPAARFASYLEWLGSSQAPKLLFKEYPVLARDVLVRLDLWSVMVREFFTRLANDFGLLSRTFGSKVGLGSITGLEVGLGDLHRGARSVIRVAFASGIEVMYKPRSLSTEVHFQDLLAWINVHDFPLQFLVRTVLDRGDYGWSAVVPHSTCRSNDEVQRFYRRQGAQIALIYVLAGSDFHHENVIASGEHPVLVDLETVLTPRRRAYVLGSSEAGDYLRESVLRSNLLPVRSWISDESPGLDYSGLAGPEGRLSPSAAWTIQRQTTDSMRFEKARIPVESATNAPRLNGARVNMTDYIDDIVNGFEQMYRYLMDHGAAMTAPGGPIEQFQSDRLRVLPVPTAVFSWMLKEASHPDNLRDGLDREAFFDRLWKLKDDRTGSAMVAAMRRALQRGDVPVFTVSANSRDLLVDDEDRLPDFFDESAVDFVVRRFASLNEADLRRQGWLVRATIAVSDVEVAELQRPQYELPPALSACNESTLIELAHAVGKEIQAGAQNGEVSLFWLGLRLSKHRTWSVAATGIDLYEGLPGIALFLAYLAEISGERKYAPLARRVVSEIRAKVDLRLRAGFAVSPGGFTGWGGLITTVATLGRLWRRRDLTDLAAEWATKAIESISEDRELDLLGGTAGLMVAAARAWHLAPADVYLQLIERGGQHLRDQAKSTERGIAWMNPRDPIPLTGLAHGASGIASALLTAATLTGNSSHADLGVAGLAYERTFFSETHRNWAHSRLEHFDPQDETLYGTFWCNGSAGAGFARLGMPTAHGNQAVAGDIETAIATTVNGGFGHGHCLCHGDLGNVDLLLTSGRAQKRADWSAQAYDLAARIIRDISQNGVRSSFPRGVQTPGLMCGLSGIGYLLLRLARPADVPSLLAVTNEVAG